MQTGIEKIENKNNALQMVSDYVTPQGMIDFKEPADMLKEMMKRVMEDPKNKDNIAGLEVMVDAAKGIVDAGREQNNQGNLLVNLLKVNQKLDMI